MFNDVQNEALAEQLREKKRFYGGQVGAIPPRAACHAALQHCSVTGRALWRRR